MTQQSAFDWSFESPLDAQAEEVIWEQFFGTTVEHIPNPTRKPYFDFYKAELSKLRMGQRSKDRALQQLAIRGQREILEIGRILQDHKDSPRKDTLAAVKSILPCDATNEAVSRTVELTVRVSLMVDMKRTANSFTSPDEPDRQWNDGQSLAQFVRGLFPRSDDASDAKDRKTNGQTFTAAFLVNVCRLSIVFTNNLGEHLKLERGKRELRIFPLKACLFAMEKNQENPIVPKSVLKETIQTLNILFPLDDPATVAMMKAEARTFHFEKPFDLPQTVDDLMFGHWGDRLLALYNVYTSPPSTWTQLFKDTRNPQLYWTFWLAFAIFVLTVLSTVATIIQTVYSVKTYYEVY
ncbi:hypothetical protein H2202_010168 [Exophiala xenobiotica]|nr:hypothetical protein H2202_010168 [Exophiala xenobiotica]